MLMLRWWMHCAMKNIWAKFICCFWIRVWFRSLKGFQLQYSDVFLYTRNTCFVAVLDCQKYWERRLHGYRLFLLINTTHCCSSTTVFSFLRIHFPPFFEQFFFPFCYSLFQDTFLNSSLPSSPRRLRHSNSDNRQACVQGWQWRRELC